MIDFKHTDLFIFDMDGTLVDSLSDLTLSLEKALQETGFGHITLEQIQEKISFGAQSLLHDLIGDNLEVHQKIFDRYVEHYKVAMFQNSPLYPGVREILQKIENKKIALLSNKREEPCRQILKHYEIDHHFDPIVGGDHPIGRKPSPKPILMICEQLDVDPKKAVMIGDSHADLIAGWEAGTKTIGILQGFTPAHVMKEVKADLWIDQIQDLEAFL